MAKMFYSIEEAAQKLGVSEDQVKEMATSGKLQQFRDRDRLMFKREQIDAMTGGSISGDDTGGPLPLASSGDTDAITLSDDSSLAHQPPRKEDPRSATGTGVSVFDAGEVEHADPMAQTHVNTPTVGDQEQLALESVGSGSGLLDLTRESDDTSLGAELLDEIYPGSGGTEGSDAKSASVPGSSGVFDGAVAVESGASGLENLQQPEPGGAANMVSMMPAEEVYDPVGSWMSLGALIGAAIALVLGMAIAIAAVSGTTSGLVTSMGASSGTVFMYAGVLLAISIVGAGIGAALGKAASR